MSMTNVAEHSEDSNQEFAAFVEKATRAYTEYVADMDRAMESMKATITVGNGEKSQNDSDTHTVENRTIRAVAAMIREMMGGDQYPYVVAEQLAKRAHEFYTLHFTLLPNIYVHETPETAAAILKSEESVVETAALTRRDDVSAKIAAALTAIKIVETSTSSITTTAATVTNADDRNLESGETE